MPTARMRRDARLSRSDTRISKSWPSTSIFTKSMSSSPRAAKNSGSTTRAPGSASRGPGGGAVRAVPEERLLSSTVRAVLSRNQGLRAVVVELARLRRKGWSSGRPTKAGMYSTSAASCRARRSHSPMSGSKPIARRARPNARQPSAIPSLQPTSISVKRSPRCSRAFRTKRLRALIPSTAGTPVGGWLSLEAQKAAAAATPGAFPGRDAVKGLPGRVASPRTRREARGGRPRDGG